MAIHIDYMYCIKDVHQIIYKTNETVELQVLSK
jgi:hypothetical protein